MWARSVNRCWLVLVDTRGTVASPRTDKLRRRRYRSIRGRCVGRCRLGPVDRRGPETRNAADTSRRGRAGSRRRLGASETHDWSLIQRA